MSSKQNKTTYDGSTPLKSVMQEMFVNNILKGLTQHEAYKQAGYNQKSTNALMANSSKLISINNVKARLAYKRADIEKKTGIDVEYCRRELLDIAKEARETGKLVVAKSCIDSLLKTIGGFQADSPSDKAIELKQMDASVRLEIAQVLNRHIDEQYLSKPIDNTIISCSSGCSDEPDSALLEQEQG